MNCVAEELNRSHESTCHWRKHKARPGQTRPGRGTFRLGGKLLTASETFPSFHVYRKAGKESLSRCNVVVRCCYFVYTALDRRTWNIWRSRDKTDISPLKGNPIVIICVLL